MRQSICDLRFDRLESLLLQALQSNPKIQPPDPKPGITPTPEPSSNGVHPEGLSRTVIQGFRQSEPRPSPTLPF